MSARNASNSILWQVVYKSRALTAFKAEAERAEQARLKLVERDREVSARISEVQLDMAALVVCPALFALESCSLF